MKVIFEINDQADAEKAARQLLAVADAFRSGPVRAETTPVAVSEDKPKVKRGREPKPVAAPETNEPAAEADPKISVVIPDDVPADPADARERLRTVAKERGVIWLRQILAECGASRLGELTDEQVRDVLSASAQ